MTEEEKEELITRILQDEIPDEEKPKVKQLLAEDKELQEELRLQLQIRRIARKEKQAEVRNIFQGYIKEKEANIIPLFSTWQRIAAAVAFILLAGIIGWLVYSRSGSTMQEGIVQLPLYELQDMSLGIGKNEQATGTVVTLFTQNAPAAYEFTDTLKIYLPELPLAGTQLQVAYHRPSDTYYLITGDTRYEIIKGLQGKQPLTEAE